MCIRDRDTTSEVRNTLKALKSSIYVTAVFDMQYLEAEIWIMADYMKTSFASSFFAVDTRSMSASSITVSYTHLVTFTNQYLLVNNLYSKNFIRILK